MYKSRLIATDPGLIRFRSALRTLLTILLAVAVLAGVIKVLGVPPTSILLGVIVAMLSSFLVNDPEPEQQRITMLLLPLPAAAAITISALLHAHHLTNDAAFLVVIFLAVCARWYGPRGLALGMVAFIAYFFSVFLAITPSALVGGYAALIVGAACGYIMKFIALPQRPERTLGPAIHSVVARAANLLQRTAEVPAMSSSSSAKDRSQLQTRVNALTDSALLVETQLAQLEPDRFATGTPCRGLSDTVFNFELAIEQITSLWLQFEPGEIPESQAKAYAEAMKSLARAIHIRDRVPSPLLPPANSSASPRARLFTQTLAEVAPLYEQLRLLTTQSQIKKLIGPTKTESSGPPSPRPPRDVVLKTAVQTVIATGLAIAIGEIISPRRWYWAVITAYITFVGSSSRGDTILKGWQRVLGTAGGVVVGAVLATLVGRNIVVGIGLILVCIFLAFYFVQLKYSLMIFWITTMLALVYGLSGQFSVGLLGLRLEETLAGAVIGAAVAFFVLPIKTTDVVIGKLVRSLRDLTGVIEASAPDPQTASDDLSTARDLDKTLQDLRQAARSLTASPSIRGRTSAPENWLGRLSECAYFSRHLSRLNIDWAATPPELVRACKAAAQALQEDISQTADAKDTPSPTPTHVPVPGANKEIERLEALVAHAVTGSEASSPHEVNRLAIANYAYLLKRLNQSFAHLSQEL